MKKKLLLRALIGFAMGAVMTLLVPMLLNQSAAVGIACSERLIARAGSLAAARLLTILVMGLFGTLCFCGTLFYEIESWPLAAATAAHYAIISLGYLLPNWLLCWDMPPRLLLGVEACMSVGFLLIWLIMFLRCKSEVRKINALLDEKKTEQKKEDKA